MSRLSDICRQELRNRGLESEKTKKRLEQELKEILKIKEDKYFLDLYDNKKKFCKNDHNLAVAYLLGLADDIDWEKNPSYTTPEMLDIDVDYLPAIRDYLKNTYAPKMFGEEYCCNIGSYNTYGLKSALIDMTRVFDGDRQEILQITTKLGLKDDEGDPLSWDKALEMYPELKAWVEKNWWTTDSDGNQIMGPSQAAKNLLYSDIDWAKFDYKGEPPHRVRGMGMHAGGLIISSIPIQTLVPLTYKEGCRISAWTEGLHEQDLGIVGLVKYDFLVIKALEKIANCVRLICERHDMTSFCAVPGGTNWSDLDKWLNDKKSLDAASAGDLKLVFQFDSPGIRKLARRVRVNSFDDIVAITAIYRPSTLDMGMDEEYVLRKRWKDGLPDGKHYQVHPLVADFMEKTYGILCYQEQVMLYLNRVGKISLEEGQPIIKAISKKNKAKIEKFKEIFIQNAQVTLSLTEEEAKKEWEMIESFGGYGFNQCLSGSTKIVNADTGKEHTLLDLYEQKRHMPVFSCNECNKLSIRNITDIFSNGFQKVFRVTTKGGKSITSTNTHRFLTEKGWQRLSTLSAGSKVGVPEDLHLNARVVWDEIVSIEEGGEEETFDLCVSLHHNYVANGLVVHNSHATAYSYLSMMMLYLKVHFPIEFYAAVMSELSTGDDRLKEYRTDAQRHGVVIEPANINCSKRDFAIVGPNYPKAHKNDKIYYGLSKVKGIGEEAADHIVSNQPYANFGDFLNKFGTNATVIKPILGLRLFPEDPLELYREYESVKSIATKKKQRDKRFSDTQTKYAKQVEELTGKNPLECGWDETLYVSQEKGCVNEFLNIKKKYDKSYSRYTNVSNVSAKEVDLDKCLTPEYKELLEDLEKAEEAYYGFLWKHPLEKCEKYTGATFENHKECSGVAGVEVLIRKVRACESKKGNTYWQLEVEDSMNEIARVNVWAEEYERFSKELVAGNMVRIRVSAPTEGYSTYSMESYPKWKGVVPPEKENDYRCVVLKEKVKESKKK